MSVELKPRTADVNGRLWGARARDWADIQEGTARPVYEAVLERTRVKSGTRYLDVGCGGGTAAQIEKTGARALMRSIGILGTCIREAPEFAGRRRHAAPERH